MSSITHTHTHKEIRPFSPPSRRTGNHRRGFTQSIARFCSTKAIVSEQFPDGLQLDLKQDTRECVHLTTPNMLGHSLRHLY